MWHVDVAWLGTSALLVIGAPGLVAGKARFSRMELSPEAAARAVRFTRGMGIAMAVFWTLGHLPRLWNGF